MTENQIIAAAWLAVGTGAAASIVLDIRAAGAWLRQQEQGIKNPKVRQALEFATAELTRVAATVVTGLNSTVVAQLKQTGQWNGQVASAVKAQAISLVKAQLASSVQAILQENGVDVPTAISNEIENAVAVAPNRVPIPTTNPLASASQVAPAASNALPA